MCEFPIADEKEQHRCYRTDIADTLVSNLTFNISYYIVVNSH